MGSPFLSRHYLAEAVRAAALLPFAPGGGGGDGAGMAHALLALGAWAQDEQEAHLTIGDLAVSYRGSEVEGQPVWTRLASFEAPAAVTSVAGVDLGSGQVLVLAAAADGSLSRLRMQVPTAPGSQPEQIQLRGDDFDGAELLPWAEPHSSAVTGLDLSSDAHAAASASADGGLALTPLDVPSGASVQLWSSGGAAAFTAVRWAGPHALVSASLTGRLQQWDARQPGAAGPALDVGAAGGQPLLCLDVHPAQSYSCAAGDAGGRVHVWDLRRATAGSAAGVAGAAAVLDVGAGSAVAALRFDSLTLGAAGGPRLVFGTAAGDVGVVRDAGAAGGRTHVVYRERAGGVSALCVGAAGPSSQLFCLTEQEGLVFMANVL